MGKYLEVYHGSNCEVKYPDVYHSKFPGDFGRGFYVTRLQNQAESRALRASDITPIVTVYNLNKKKFKDFNYKCFEYANREWMEVVYKGRKDEELPYDIIEGQMADGNVKRYIENYEKFLKEEIDEEEFLDMYIFKGRFDKKLNSHQIAFLKQEALKCLDFLYSYNVKGC